RRLPRLARSQMSASVWPVVEQRCDDLAGGVDRAVAITLFAEWGETSTDVFRRQSLMMPKHNGRQPVGGEPQAVFATCVVRQEAHPGTDLRGGGMHRSGPRIAHREVLEESCSDLPGAIAL